MKLIATESAHIGILFGTIDKKPRKPAEPRAAAVTCIKPAKAAPTPAPIKAQKNGNLYFKLTPNNAGSVIPSNAETPDELAKPLTFSFLVKK